jgi:MYXO-CTERM domain-containing protein
MRKLLQVSVAAVTLVTGAAPAALVDRGGGIIYDDVLKITWLQDWNYAGLHCTDDSGLNPECHVCPPDNPGAWAPWCGEIRGAMPWDDARRWAKNLVHGGFDDWRLPAMRDTGPPGCDLNFAGGTDCGYNVQTKAGGTVYSEMAHLWYVTLGNVAYCDPVLSTAETCVRQEGWDTPNFGPFQNIQTALRADYYWTGVPYNSQSFEPASWYFRPTSGYQDWEIRRFGGFAVAVRPGPVPEPPTAALALLALGLAAVLRRKAS